MSKKQGFIIYAWHLLFFAKHRSTTVSLQIKRCFLALYIHHPLPSYHQLSRIEIVLSYTCFLDYTTWTEKGCYLLPFASSTLSSVQGCYCIQGIPGVQEVYMYITCMGNLLELCVTILSFACS